MGLMSKTFEVTNYVENEDGTATITLDMDEETTNEFLRFGMKIALEELGAKYSVVSPQEWEELQGEIEYPEPRTYELNSQEVHGFLQIGIVKAIMLGIEHASRDN